VLVKPEVVRYKSDIGQCVMIIISAMTKYKMLSTDSDRWSRTGHVLVTSAGRPLVVRWSSAGRPLLVRY